MLRHSFPQEPLHHGVIGVLFATLAATISLVIWAANAVIASSTAEPGGAILQTSLRPLAVWVKATGKETVMRGRLASALGLADSDLPVLERGFRSEGERLTHVCSVASLPGYDDLVLVASVDENTGDAMVWRADLAGNLVSSVKFLQGVAVKIANEETEALFASEKAYLLRKMQRDSFRINTAPAPKQSSAPVPERTKAGPEIPKLWRKTALPSEWILVLTHPWITPAIALILTLALLPPRRR